jgi:hypothetical protein
MTNCILAASLAAHAQAPGVDPRGVAVYSAPVIIGVVEQPWRMVIRPDKLAKKSTAREQPDGTYIVELPQKPLDYLIGYLFRIHVQEVLKPDGRVRANQTIEVFAPFRLEGGVSLPPEKRFLLALAAFIPKEKEFDKTTVIKVGQSSSKQGASFDLRARYYSVVSDANGAVQITDKNRRLIDEIRTLVRDH